MEFNNNSNKNINNKCTEWDAIPVCAKFWLQRGLIKLLEY